MPTESIYFTKTEYGILWTESVKTGKTIAEIVKACVNEKFFKSGATK